MALSYFDHVRCHGCRAMVSPESLARVPGQGLTCPSCNAPLSVTDLFGLSAAFAEEEEGDLSLDDLVGAGSGTSAPPSAPPSAPRVQEPVGKSGSAALDLMRELKRRK